MADGPAQLVRVAQVVLLPAAPFVIRSILHDARLHGVLVDVAQQRREILHVVAWLALEPFLKQVADALVLLVVVIHIAARQALYHLRNLPVLFHHQQVEMVRHQAPCVDCASANGQQTSVFVVLERQVRKNIHKPSAVLIIVEDGLTVYPSHHHVVDAIAAFLSGTPWHVMVLLSSYATHG